MFSTSRDVRRIDSRITVDNYTFDTVKKFRKVLRKIFGSVRVGDDFRIRFNSELLYELLNDMDVVQRVLISSS